MGWEGRRLTFSPFHAIFGSQDQHGQATEQVLSFFWVFPVKWALLMRPFLLHRMVVRIDLEQFFWDLERRMVF